MGGKKLAVRSGYLYKKQSVLANYDPKARESCLPILKIPQETALGDFQYCLVLIESMNFSL